MSQRTSHPLTRGGGPHIRKQHMMRPLSPIRKKRFPILRGLDARGFEPTIEELFVGLGGRGRAIPHVPIPSAMLPSPNVRRAVLYDKLSRDLEEKGRSFLSGSSSSRLFHLNKKADGTTTIVPILKENHASSSAPPKYKYGADGSKCSFYDSHNLKRLELSGILVVANGSAYPCHSTTSLRSSEVCRVVN